MNDMNNRRCTAVVAIALASLLMTSSVSNSSPLKDIVPSFGTDSYSGHGGDKQVNEQISIQHVQQEPLYDHKATGASTETEAADVNCTDKNTGTETAVDAGALWERLKFIKFGEITIPARRSGNALPAEFDNGRQAATELPTNNATGSISLSGQLPDHRKNVTLTKILEGQGQGQSEAVVVISDVQSERSAPGNMARSMKTLSGKQLTSDGGNGEEYNYSIVEPPIQSFGEHPGPPEPPPPGVALQRHHNPDQQQQFVDSHNNQRAMMQPGQVADHGSTLQHQTLPSHVPPQISSPFSHPPGQPDDHVEEPVAIPHSAPSNVYNGFVSRDPNSQHSFTPDQHSEHSEQRHQRPDVLAQDVIQRQLSADASTSFGFFGSTHGNSYAPQPSAYHVCHPVPDHYCYGKFVGHFQHPFDVFCFIVCDEFGVGHGQACAPGTVWKTYREEDVGKPADFNKCS